MAEAKTEVKRSAFGRMPDGATVDLFTLNAGLIEARIITYGAILVSLKVPDRDGGSEDVVLGFDHLDEYVANNNGDKAAFFGATIGRYANRIARGTFTLNGKKYLLSRNDGENSLHGGALGFHNVVWVARPIEDGVEFTYLSKDEEEGYPGNLPVNVRYLLIKNELRIEYSATSDKDTVVNLTNHSYFNLVGQGRGDVLGHQLKLGASVFTPVDSNLIPTGERRGVASTPFDFRKPRRIGERIDAADEQLRLARGYDHNWILDGAGGELAEAAEVHEPVTGRTMRVLTSEPGIQFYSGNFRDGTIKGKGRRVYVKHSGFCLETQHFPDSPNHSEFPATVLKAGERYRSVTAYEFSSRPA
jgi:aldose 1-epimerase